MIRKMGSSENLWDYSFYEQVPGLRNSSPATFQVKVTGRHSYLGSLPVLYQVKVTGRHSYLGSLPVLNKANSSRYCMFADSHK